MVAFSFVLSLALCTWPATRALQVTPNSACAQICMGDPTRDATDQSLASTTGSDIVCKDDDYPQSAAGQSFEDCINCLQNSTFAESGESDQAWWLYNLRFAINTCLFNTANATDPISTPCSTDSVCGPLSKALQDGMQDPSTLQEFSYCTVDYNSFRGRYLQTCTTCLRESANLVYLANFLVALNAGCIQQPPAGLLIGVNSTLFTENAVTMTSPMTSPPQPPKPHKPLSKTSIIAISVVCGVAGLIIIALVFMCARRHINERRLKELQSPLDARFGAPNISAPHSNAYASPESPPLVKEAIAMSGGPQMANTSRHGSVGTVDNGDQQSPAFTPPPFGVSIPTHHAYLPPRYTPRSRNSLSPKYGSLPPSLQHLPSAPYPTRSLSPTSSPSASPGKTPPPTLPSPPPPPVPTPTPIVSPPYVPSPSSIPTPREVPQPSPAVSAPDSTSSFSLGRILNRSSHSSGETSRPRFSLSQRSFGRGHTGTRRDARNSFQISGPILNGGTGLSLQAPAAPSSRTNNRRRTSISSTDSDPLW